VISAAGAVASFPALGSTAVVAVTQRDLLAEAEALLAADLHALDLACSRFRNDSELVRVNERSGRPVGVSPLLAEATRAALDAAWMTDGLVDPTLGSQLRAAGYDRTFALVRERNTWHIASIPRPTGSWRDVELDDKRRTLQIPHGVELDLGATAKAWAADRSAERIARALRTGVLVSLGGDIAVAGPPPHGGWPVRLAEDHASSPADPGPVVAIRDGGLATSGTAVRRWRTDRGDAHHILDPRSGEPALTPWAYVSVAAASCLEANVAATAAIVLAEEAPHWLAKRRLPARAVRRDGTALAIGTWPEEARAA
jgi:thiamine biosynthesis lipoprotein